MEDITVPTTKRIYKPIINLVKRDFSVENCETPLASCHWNKKRKLERRCNRASDLISTINLQSIDSFRS